MQTSDCNEVWTEVVALIESFATSCRMPLARKGIGSIPDFSFGHNLCCRCPNGPCKPILDIYISITFQWYKELFKSRGFGPCNYSMKIRESTGTPTPNMGVHLGVWVFILTFSHTPGSLSWLDLLQTLALVTSPRLRLWHQGAMNLILWL